MESLQLSQVLADLSNLGAAEPEAAAAIVTANTNLVKSAHPQTEVSTPIITNSTSTTAHQTRPSGLSRHWSSEGKFDKFGRRILINSPNSRPGSAANSIPGTPRRGDSDYEDDVDRASTLLALYDIRSRIKQQDNSSLLRAREKINALAAKQQGYQAAEGNMKASDQLRRNRYSFPRM